MVDFIMHLWDDMLSCLHHAAFFAYLFQVYEYTL